MITLDTRSPERGWQPLLDWLSDHGLDPSRVRAVTVDEQTLAGEVTVYKMRGGKKYVIGDHLATKQQRVQFRSLPPRRAA